MSKVMGEGFLDHQCGITTARSGTAAGKMLREDRATI
jgi:hypothetical protein